MFFDMIIPCFLIQNQNFNIDKVLSWLLDTFSSDLKALGVCDVIGDFNGTIFKYKFSNCCRCFYQKVNDFFGLAALLVYTILYCLK